MSDMHPYTYKAQVQNVVDGDTFDLLLDLGFRTKRYIRARLLGVDTAEIHNVEEGSDEYERGVAHMEFVKSKISEADQILVRTYKNDDTGKYGRWLVEIVVDGNEISDLLTEEFTGL